MNQEMVHFYITAKVIITVRTCTEHRKTLLTAREISLRSSEHTHTLTNDPTRRIY